MRLKELPASLLLIAGLCIAGCGVNIETGPPTADEKSRTSEVRGKGVRSDWVNRFEAATLSSKGMMFKTFVDSVSSRYIEYGYSVSDQWRQGNEGRGEEVSDTEMREMVARWTETEKPLIQSYDDVVEYAIERVRETGQFDRGTEDILQKMVDNYYEVYSTVFFPTGSVADYEYRLAQLQTGIEEISRQVQDAMQVYR
jgi:hypothetical protein